MIELSHRAGFVSIVGRPNVGKSTLMNALVGEKISIITSKAQTTRHRIMGIINGEDFQIVYSDTPGIIEPKYELQKKMMDFVSTSLEDSDIILFVTEVQADLSEEQTIATRLLPLQAPTIVLINKIDIATAQEVKEKITFWENFFSKATVLAISAQNNFNLTAVLQNIIEQLPVHPPYFDKEELTDKTERFFAAEMIREQIFLQYDKEIPYSSEVQITSFKESEDIIRIASEIIVERDSQKGIIVGKAGSALKKVGTEARKSMEAFFGKKVFLEQFVKVEKDWRKTKSKLERFGYVS